MVNIILTLYTKGFFSSFLKSPTQMGSLSINNFVTNISRLGTFKYALSSLGSPKQAFSKIGTHLRARSVLKLGFLKKFVRYRKMPIFRTPPLISDKSGGFTTFLATGKVIDKYKILKLLN
jgi:hypothetical protein